MDRVGSGLAIAAVGGAVWVGALLAARDLPGAAVTALAVAGVVVAGYRFGDVGTGAGGLFVGGAMALASRGPA